MKPSLIACKLLKAPRQADSRPLSDQLRRLSSLRSGSLRSALVTTLLLAPLAALSAADDAGTNLIASPAKANTQTVSGMALRWQRPAGAPKHSDVCFSIRWMRKDVDPFEKIAAFHGTRFDWVYATKEFIAQCALRGYPICHCTSPARQDSGPGEGSASATYQIGRAEGLRGQPLTASWQNWSPPWGCYSNPDFFRLMKQDAIFAVESGATYMHVDDPDTRQMLEWGVDERQTVLEIPALNPWAMLLVSPAKQENP